MITEKMANLIMGALDCLFQEGGNCSPYTGEELTQVELELVQLLFKKYPDVVTSYSWLPTVINLRSVY